MYLSHFNTVTLKVCNLDQSITIMVLKSGLQNNAFIFFLEKTYPKSFIEMPIRMERYTNSKEAYDAQLVSTEAKVKQRLESSRQTLVERGNRRNRQIPMLRRCMMHNQFLLRLRWNRGWRV